MMRSRSERTDRPHQPRLGKQRSIPSCCCCGDEDRSFSEGRPWLRGSSRKVMSRGDSRPTMGENENENENSWWQKGWNSVRKAGEWSENFIEEAGTRSGPKWKLFVRKLKTEGRSIYPRKPVRFQYDALSYAQNFDEGSWQESESPYQGFSARFAVPTANPWEK